MTTDTRGKQDKLPFSYHIFLFPFKWNFGTGDPPNDPLKSIDAHLVSNNWERFTGITDPVDDYNKQAYFHPFTHEALMDKGKAQCILRQYTYKNTGKGISLYCIGCGKEKEERTYQLCIEKIQLNIYATGVGILAYFLENGQYADRKDIFIINDRGRRIYPPFLAGHPLTQEPKKSLLAHRLELHLKKGEPIIEDFSGFNKEKDIPQNYGKISRTVMEILGPAFYSGDKETATPPIHIEPVIDDRMFVLCWMHDKKWCNQLLKYGKRNETYAYSTDDDWYSYLFIDGDGATCKGINKKKRLLTGHTDERWLDKEKFTLFGISRYSFVVLTKPGHPLFPLHLHNLYLEMVRLSLMQRASILHFSRKITTLSGNLTETDAPEQLGRLHQQYLQFVNKMYFREVTAQEQGIELYDKLQYCMQIERDIKDLNREIDELHQSVSLEEERKNSKQLHILTVIGALLVLPMFITGFFGMNIFSEKMEVANDYIYGSILVYILLGGLLTYYAAKTKVKKAGRNVLLVLILIITLCIMLYPYLGKVFGVL